MKGTERFLTPTKSGDVFAIFGSGSKYHVVDSARIYERSPAPASVARCGRKGRKVRVSRSTTPANTLERYSVCVDCREFTRGVE